MKRKQTKIVATISDINCSVELIRTLHQNGVNVVRLNTAHQSLEGSKKVIENVRAVSDRIGILLDTKGPEVRTRGLTEPLHLTEGQAIRIIPEGNTSFFSEPVFSVSWERFTTEIPVGSMILVDDGEMAFSVTECSDNTLLCKVLNSGTVKNKKTVNVPGVHLDLPALTDRDREYIAFAAEQDLDFIAHSFVRNKRDLEQVQEVLTQYGSKAQIIAKIENREGVDNLEEILDLAFGIMVARGDLGIEIPAEEVPAVQKRIIMKCNERAKPVITATQLLHTMIENPRPTRAEVSDVANAVFDGTDAVMLSGETAYGKYPLEAVQIMAKIVKETERNKPSYRDLPVSGTKNKIRNFLAKAAITAAKELPVQAIVVDTLTGHSARILSSYRAQIPIYAKCHDPHVVRKLSLTYGVYPTFMEMPATTDLLVSGALNSLLGTGDLEKDDLVVILASWPGHSNGSSVLEINTVRLCIDGRAPV